MHGHPLDALSCPAGPGWQRHRHAAVGTGAPLAKRLLQLNRIMAYTTLSSCALDTFSLSTTMQSCIRAPPAVIKLHGKVAAVPSPASNNRPRRHNRSGGRACVKHSVNVQCQLCHSAPAACACASRRVG
jgi:hypothetical protein